MSEIIGTAGRKDRDVQAISELACPVCKHKIGMGMYRFEMIRDATLAGEKIIALFYHVECEPRYRTEDAIGRGDPPLSADMDCIDK